MYNQPLVSVIMNCFNSDKYLKEAIDSVLAQTYQNWELVFWDNQSTDDSANIVKSYKDNRIKYFYASSFEPLCEARNLAIEKANGEYIAFLDCDDKWYNKKLERQLNLLNNSMYSFCYTNYYLIYNDFLKKAFVKKQPSGNIFEYQISNYSIGLLSVMIKKSKLDEMDEKFDKNLTYPGDFDLFVRFLYKNKAIYIDECLCEYRANNSNSITNTRQLENLLQTRLAIKKLSNLFCNDKNKKIFEILNVKNIIQESGYYFRNGNFKKTREIITPIKLFNKKSFALYVATFLPNIFLKYISRKV
ncbi:glycosyltransferase, family 2, putative [Campylobacter iguaniorum]|uniref:glycosyltransferase family 2 protein n=1 Tax=Campylobacter iguaniorum TaxID=1244531 RepID=UPI00073A0C21|nr:glycosyltransferase [Campylobacter iguaniorum]ALV23671.1 glycosyltransferase, family 2, putative [Campylobacter iguaniorum]